MKCMLQGSPCPTQKVYRKNPVWTENFPTHFITNTFPLRHSTLAPPCPSLRRRVNRYLLAHVAIVIVSYRFDTSVILSTKGGLLLWEILSGVAINMLFKLSGRNYICMYIYYLFSICLQLQVRFDN